MPQRKTGAKAERKTVRRRRGPRQTVARTRKARKPRSDTLTLEKFEAALREQSLAYRAVRFDENGRPIEYEDEPTRDRAFARRRAAVEGGDLMAHYTALEWCYLDRWGWPLTDPKDPDPERLIEIPVWLVRALQKLVYRGIQGKWPRRVGRHSTEAARLCSEEMHLARTYWVLRARKAGIPWEEVFERVSEFCERKSGKPKVPARTIEASYNKVAKAFRSSTSPTEFWIRFPIPEEWEP